MEVLFGYEKVNDDNVIFHGGRDLSEAETKTSRSAEALLDGVTHNAFGDLRSAESQLHALIENSEAGGITSGNFPQASRSIQREVKGWLSAFKSFEDRTAAWLSGAFGREESAEYRETFASMLRTEFDQNFAYRLCCALRNASIHAGDVIDVSLSTRLAEGEHPSSSRQPVSSLALRVDVPKVAERFPRMASPKKLRELKSAAEPLDFEWVVGAATLSCWRVHAALLVLLWDRIQPAVAAVEAFHREATEMGGLLAVFIDRQTLITAKRAGTGPTHLRWNSIELALATSQEHEGSEALLRSDMDTSCSWQDLVWR